MDVRNAGRVRLQDEREGHRKNRVNDFTKKTNHPLDTGENEMKGDNQNETKVSHLEVRTR